MTYLSSLAQTKNVIYCGLKMARNRVNAAIYGPPAYEIANDIDLTGKTCLITGANSGIGLEMMRCLSARGSDVLIACRNTYAAGVVAKNDQRLQIYEVNLASLSSVKKCSDAMLNDAKKIDIVVLNAGVFGLPWTLTEDNLETTFQVNYLSQYYLLMNIEPILAPDARVVFVSSESHRNVNWSFKDQLNPTKDTVSLPRDQYTSIKAYNISKLCGLLSMHYLGYRWLKTPKSVFCAHPGTFVKTRLCRNWWPYEALYTIMLPFSKSISQAAATPLYCATSPDLNGQSALYYRDCQRTEESELAKDFHLAFRINDLSRELIQERVANLADDVKPGEPTIAPSQTRQVIDETLTPYCSA